jgi:DNA-binding response OmpR family regulator
MPTVWIVASAIPPLIEIFQTFGWNVMLTAPAPVTQSQGSYPDVAVYPIEDESFLPRFATFCKLKITPVLALTTDWVLAWQAVEAGADDVVTTPLDYEEVLFRVRWLARGLNTVQIGKLTIDLVARNVRYNGYPIHLSPAEFRVLVCLVELVGQAVSFNQILDAAWGCDSETGGTLAQVKTVVKRLRKKIEPDPCHPQYIISVRTIGYRLRSQTQWEDNL